MAANLLAEISAAALEHNLRFLRQRLSPGTRLCPVVKVDAYGHGLDQLLPVLAPNVDGLAVATHEEAMHLREKGFEGSVLVFFTPFALDREDRLDHVLRHLISAGITLTISSEREANAVLAASRAVGKPAEAHLKVDTGMNRSGARWEDAASLLAELRQDRELRLTGAYTHFATAEEDLAFTRRQLARFLEVVEAGGGRQGLVLHAANSAALLGVSESHLDMVRPGLAVYGCHAVDEAVERPPLKPVLRLTTRLMQVKTVRAGEGCGYGLVHVFDRDSVIGLVPVGYGDGYLRALSNTSQARIRDSVVPVRGRIAMDQIIVDLDGVEEPRVGESIEIIAADPSAPNSVEGLSRFAGTLPHELLCRLGPRIERRLVAHFADLSEL